jgi:hypothetical protein
VEPSDWFNLVQQQMAESRENYERLKRTLDIEEWLSTGDSPE